MERRDKKSLKKQLKCKWIEASALAPTSAADKVIAPNAPLAPKTASAGRAAWGIDIDDGEVDVDAEVSRSSQCCSATRLL